MSGGSAPGKERSLAGPGRPSLLGRLTLAIAAVALASGLTLAPLHDHALGLADVEARGGIPWGLLAHALHLFAGAGLLVTVLLHLGQALLRLRRPRRAGGGARAPGAGGDTGAPREAAGRLPPAAAGGAWRVLKLPVALGVTLVLAGTFAVLRKERRAALLVSGPTSVLGRTERCLACHLRPEQDPGGAHAALAIGCSSCHLGDPLAFEEARAHEGLEPEPGALDTVDLTCARAGCHEREGKSVRGSLMATNKGLISVDRWAFGELPTPDGEETMAELLVTVSPSPAQSHLRRLCAGCHLGARKENRDDAIVVSGSGCSACHVESRRPTDPPRRHPPVNSDIPDDRCTGCHSRSARIGLSYHGLAELDPAGAPACEAQVTLADGRLACRATPDVHQQAGLRCVDCHLHSELMGDAAGRHHEEEQVEISCQGCHRTGADGSWGEVVDPISRDLVRLAGELRAPEEEVRVGRYGTPLRNVRPGALPGSPWRLVRKADGVELPLLPVPADRDHQRRGHERLACSTCHAAWAPTCTSCHTRFEPEGEQWDFGAGAVASGAWRETSEGFAVAPPALAVNAGDRIVPAVPGMIATVATGESAPRTLRLFAAIEPHTTGKQARSCASCHANGAALGLGRGELELDAEPPRFLPSRTGAGLAAAGTAPGGRAGVATDGWTTLLAERPAPGTRQGLRSLAATEQLRVLRVGACLPCHDPATDPLFESFPRSLERLASGRSGCALPPRGWLRP